MLQPFSEPIAFQPDMPARVEHVSQSEQAPPPEPFLHFHGPAELVLVAKGSGRFLCEGQNFPFGPGSILYAPALTIHDFAFEASARAWTLIQFDATVLRLETLPRRPLSITPQPDAQARIATLVEWLAQPGSRHAPLIKLEALILALFEGMEPDAAEISHPPSSLSKFRPLLDQLNGDLGRTQSLAKAAGLCAMSPTYFSRRFTKTFGVGFNAYQTRLRLQQAARLLASSDEAVSQIGYKLGFQSHAYFTQRYRAAFGVTPSEHRRRLLKGKS